MDGLLKDTGGQRTSWKYFRIGYPVPLLPSITPTLKRISFRNHRFGVVASTRWYDEPGKPGEMRRTL